MCSFLFVTMVRFNRERHKCYFVPLFRKYKHFKIKVLLFVIFPIHFQWPAIFDKCDFVQFCTK